MKTKIKFISSALVWLTVLSTASAQDSTNAGATLQQDVAQLQNSPDDQALRSNIIQFAATMKSPPAIPAEANRHFIMGNTLYHDAKIPSDYQLAASEYHQALLLAPWWGTVYANEGLALQKAGQYDAAIADLNLYLLTHPADAADVTNQIYAIEAEKELAAKRAADAAQQQAQQAAAVEQQKEQQAKEEQQQAAQEQQQAEQQKQAAQDKASQKLVGQWVWLRNDINRLIILTVSYSDGNWSANITPNPYRAAVGLFHKDTITSIKVTGMDEVNISYLEQTSGAYQSSNEWDVDVHLSTDGKQLRGTVTDTENGQAYNEVFWRPY